MQQLFIMYADLCVATIERLRGECEDLIPCAVAIYFAGIYKAEW